MSSCPVCGSTSSRDYSLFNETGLSSITHLDFKPVPEFRDCTLFQCNSCTHIYVNSSFNRSEYISNQFKSNEYAQILISNNPDKSEGHSVSTERLKKTERQLLSLNLPNNSATYRPLRVMDVGCFDGLFLRTFNQFSTDSYLLGVDVIKNPYFSRLAPDAHFITLDQLQYITASANFDYITLFHSLTYEPRPLHLISLLRSFLSSSGRLVIEVPSPELRPSCLLLADQDHHFTILSLQELLVNAGFNRHSIITEVTGSNLTISAFINSPYEMNFTPFPGDQIETSNLNDLLARLTSLKNWSKQFSDFKIAILGSSYTAALLHQLDPFLDALAVTTEGGNISFVGKRLCTLHSVQEYIEILIVPVGLNSERLASSLTQQYPHLHIIPLPV